MPDEWDQFQPFSPAPAAVATAPTGPTAPSEDWSQFRPVQGAEDWSQFKPATDSSQDWSQFRTADDWSQFQTPSALSVGFHRAMNDVREFGANLGKGIMNGLAWSAEQSAKALPDGSPEQTQLRAFANDQRDHAATAEQDSGVDPALSKTWDAQYARGQVPLIPPQLTVPYWAGKEAQGLASLLPDDSRFSTALKVVGGAETGLANLTSGLTTSQNLAMLPAIPEGVAGKAVAGVFLGQAIAGTPEKWRGLNATKDVGEKARILTEMGGSYLLPALAFAHSGGKIAEQGESALEQGVVTTAAAEPVTPPPSSVREIAPSEIPGPSILQTAEGPSTPSPQIEASPGLTSLPDSAATKASDTFPETQTDVAGLPSGDAAPAVRPETQTDVAGFPVQEIPTEQIASRPDLMQFKQMDDTTTGENANDQITTQYDPLKAGNLLLWQPTDPEAYGLKNEEKYIVANGHHRNAAALEQGVVTQNAQIIRESEGYSPGDARSLAAEANIADGKGTIYDQAKFIREQGAAHGPDAALARAGQIGARGRKAATIGIEAGPDLFTSFVNEQITPDQAFAVASAAPRDIALQRLGIQRARAGDSPQEVGNFLQAVRASTGPTATARQIDLFGADDAALNQAGKMAKQAGAIQREIAEQINAVAGAAKRPEKAAALGVDVRDPADVQTNLAELQALRERARNWSADPEIRELTTRESLDAPAVVNELRGKASEIAETAGPASPEIAPRLRRGENEGDLLQGRDQPFNLAGESGVDYGARAAEEQRNAQRTAEAVAAQDEAQSKLFAQGSSSPRRAQSAQTTSAQPSPSAGVVPIRSWWQQKTLGLRKLMAPQTIDDHALKVANITRDYNGQLANNLARADAALAEWRASFDRTPVPRDWKYEAAKPLPRNYAFMVESERGGQNLSPAEKLLKEQLDKMFSGVVDEVHRVKPEALQSLIQDYFPHIWQDPETASRAFAAGSRNLEGSKAFTKKRALAYIEDGLKLGLKPVSDNPIDIALTKLHEMRKFVAAQDILSEAKEIGARKFVYIFENPPEGWVKVDDPTTTVHGPPFVSVPEAFDQQMKAKTLELLDDLGIRNDRVRSLGGRRWGTYETGGEGIKTKFAGPLSVYWHELGHGLEERYHWIDQILGNVSPSSRDPIAVELRNLADLRLGPDPSKSFKQYVRSKDEKAAVMLEAYVHAPDRMQQVAPTIYARVRQFIADRPELHPIDDLRPSLELGSAKQQIPVGGMVTLGNYYMPEGAAAVLRNYLSPGLQRFGVIRNLRTMTNLLNASQLGFSAFHAGFTSIDAAISTWALGLQYLGRGEIGRGLGRIAASPFAPVANYYTGKAIQNEMLHPGAGEVKILGLSHKLSPEGQARVEQIAQLAVKAGLRATIDPFWKTQISRNLVRAFHEGGVQGYAGTVLRAPFAAVEQLMRPIAETLVPRQKLGVFAGMAREAMDRLGPNAAINDVRAALAKAADATEDRMGQMTYDNLFYNRVVKDAALMGFRAYGWTYGKYRSLLGGISDTIRTPTRIAAGEPLLSPRMAYLIALPMVAGTIGATMNYLMTGQYPQDWRDLFMPRTGKSDANGNAQRISPPTYLKDFLSDWHDAPDLKAMLRSFYHKLNPWISVGIDIVRNADFYNTKVYNEGDPWLKQQVEKFAYALKAATPFSVTGAVKLSESKPGLAQYALPFFGFVPAKTALTMTPAQNRAAELFRETLPAGARTAEEAGRSQLFRQLINDLKSGDQAAPGHLRAAVQSGQLKPTDLPRIISGLQTTPFQYQVKKLNLDDAMKVWDLANDQERSQLRPILQQKIVSSKTVPFERRLRYGRVVSGLPPLNQSN